jgi:hypothetical protein
MAISHNETDRTSTSFAMSMYSSARGASRSGASVQYSKAEVSKTTTSTGSGRSRFIPFAHRRKIGILVQHQPSAQVANDLPDIALRHIGPDNDTQLPVVGGAVRRRP